jgi:cyclophilin family peptidyl-prolyl cis-trans isomerase
MKLPIALTVLILLQAPVRPPQAGPLARAPLGAEPLAVLNAERAWTAADGLWLLLKRDNTSLEVRDAAVRAIGRAEDPQQVRPLMALTGVSASAQAAAIAQSLYGFDPAGDPDLLRVVDDWMRMAASQGRNEEERMMAAASIARPMAHIVYAVPEQVAHAESLLRGLVDFSADTSRYGGLYEGGIHALEALARVDRTLAHFDERTIALLKKCVERTPVNAQSPEVRMYAFMALASAGGADADVVRAALGDTQTGAWIVRRAAMAMLAGTGAGLDDDGQVSAITDGLSDEDAHVRYEAVRAWARRAAAGHGCQPLVDALKDADDSVALQAEDLLGSLCLDDEGITTRLEGLTTVPSTVGPWQRPTHAFAALAKRSPEKAAIFMGGFTTHPVWWVRMYAAFAAGGAKDAIRLNTLAYDENDNVREAALNHLRAVDADLAAPAIMAALERTDVQLVRTAAGMVQEWPGNRRYVRPLLDSLQRLTKQHSMTSRDGRLALLAAIEKHGAPDDYTELVPYLKDFDAKIADRAADVIAHLSGKMMKAEPIPSVHVPAQPFDDLRRCVSIDMSSGHPIVLEMRPGWAPIAAEQFLRLAIVDRYYNGLTFHRVVPNFVVQGGSPNANEYSGGNEFLRDEIAGSNVRGTVGLSTRGRNTGDAQFFINLVDNPRLDGNYTVFAVVQNMDAVDRLQEGDVMRTIEFRACR